VGDSAHRATTAHIQQVAVAAVRRLNLIRSEAGLSPPADANRPAAKDAGIVILYS